MMYRYSVYTSDRKIVHGTIESATLEAAETSLYKAGYQRILGLKKATSAYDWKSLVYGPPHVNPETLLDFTNEMAILLDSGLTLLVALKQIEKQSGDSKMSAVVAKLAADIQGGVPFHQALNKHPSIFSETYCSIIEANEKSGTLDNGLHQIAKQIKQQIALRSQIQRAVTQPAIIIILALVVVAIMAIVVLPQLTNIFKQFGANLPVTTRILISFSDFITEYKVAILVAVVLMAVLVGAFLKHPSTKPLLDKLLVSLPLIGQTVIWNNTAYFSRTLSNLLSSGILLPDCINILLRGIGNTSFREALDNARKDLLQGQSLSGAMAKNKLFPSLLIEMVGVGEASGNLEMSLGTTADYFEAKVDKRVSRLVALIEPALLIVVGLIVAFIAVTMISTIYGLVGTFQS